MDDFDDDGADVFAGVDVDGGAVVVVAVHGDGGVDGLEERVFVDAGEDESGVVEAFGALGGGADADGGEGVAYGGEEAGFFGEGAGVGDDGGGVHLQAVVVVEAERFMLDYTPVEFEAGLLQALARAGMAAVEYRHVVFAGDGVDGVEEREEVFLGVDVLLAVSRQKDVSAFFETEAGVDVAGFDLFEVLVEHFGHRRAGEVGALFGQTAVGEVSAGVLRVAEVDVGDNINYSAVGLFGQTFVFAAVARLHVENGDVQTFCGDGREAGVGVAEDEECVGVDGRHQLVGTVDDVADGGAEVVTDGIHINLGVFQFEVLEEDAVEVVVVVLAGVGEDYVEVLAALVDGGCQTDDLGACAHDYQQLEFAVAGKLYIFIISLHRYVDCFDRRTGETGDFIEAMLLSGPFAWRTGV